MAYIWKESQICRVSINAWQKCAETCERGVLIGLLVSLLLHPHARGHFLIVGNYFVSHDVVRNDTNNTGNVCNMEGSNYWDKMVVPLPTVLSPEHSW